MGAGHGWSRRSSTVPTMSSDGMELEGMLKGKWSIGNIGLVPLERTFTEERSITRSSSVRSLRTPSTKAAKYETKWDGLCEEESGGARTSSEMSWSTRSTGSGEGPVKKSFIRWSLKGLARRQSEKGDPFEDLSMMFHSKYSIVKAVNTVKEILKQQGHKFTQEKREETIRCSVPVRNHIKPLNVTISFVFDVGQTEITVFCLKPPRHEQTRTAFVNFYKVILVGLRATGNDAVLP